MKIIAQKENWTLNNETKTANVGGMTKSIYADVPCILAGIQFKEISVDSEFISLPYLDEKLQKSIGGLAYDIATNNEWCYPDYDNVKLSIWVHMDSEVFKASLRIDVQPPKYTEEEKANILREAQGDEDYYQSWLDIFASAEAFHNGNYTDMSESMGLYDIEFTTEEQNELQWFLIGHLQMVCNGGHYVA